MSPKILAAVGSSLLLVLAAAPVAGPASGQRVQKAELTILPGDRVAEPNIALAPGIPVRMTVINATHEFHTFTVPALGLSRLIPPAHAHGAAKVTFTFETSLWGSLAWYCLICPTGRHGPPHEMRGALYLIVAPTAIP